MIPEVFTRNVLEEIGTSISEALAEHRAKLNEAIARGRGNLTVSASVKLYHDPDEDSVTMQADVSFVAEKCKSQARSTVRIKPE